MLWEEGYATDALAEEDGASFYLEDGARPLLESVVDNSPVLQLVTNTTTVYTPNITVSAIPMALVSSAQTVFSPTVTGGDTVTHGGNHHVMPTYGATLSRRRRLGGYSPYGGT